MISKNVINGTAELTNIVINHLNVGVFVIDQQYQIKSLNDNFSEKISLFFGEDGARICNSLVGCVNAEIEQKSIGNVQFCIECELMAAIKGALFYDIEIYDKTLVRQHDKDRKPLRKYYRYSCKPLMVDGKKNALLMIDDITDIEENRAELFEQNRIVHRLNDKFKKDLALAKSVQKSIIPKEPVVYNDYHIDFIYFPLEAIGGDMFDIFKIDDRYIGIFMCDVVGHGLPAAMVTTMVKALLASYSDSLICPKRLMDKLNSQLVEMVEEPYMTAFYGVIDTVKHTFNFVRAGHPFPWKLNDAIQTFGHQSNPIIGISSDISYVQESIDLNNGDKIILYTDGLLDVGTDDGNYESRLLNLFDSNLHITGKKLLDVLKNDLITNVVYDKHMDDVCVLIIERISK